MDPSHDPATSPVLRLVEPGEEVHIVTEAAGTHLLVTDRRLAVASGDRVALDVAFPSLRLIQFDIERKRPATLVIVPEEPTHEPQVLAVPRARYDDITTMLAAVGHRLAESEAAS